MLIKGVFIMNIRKIFLSIILLFFSMSNSFAMSTGAVENLRWAINEQNVQQIENILSTQVISVEELQSLVETVLSVNNSAITDIILDAIHNPRQVSPTITRDVQRYSGTLDPFEAPPIPLVHQVNACYFNSAFQALVVIPGLKEALMPYACCNKVAKLFVEFLDLYHAAYNNPLYTDLFHRLFPDLPGVRETISHSEKTRFQDVFKRQDLEQKKMKLVNAVFNCVNEFDVGRYGISLSGSATDIIGSYSFMDAVFRIATGVNAKSFLDGIGILLDYYNKSVYRMSSENFLSGVRFEGGHFGDGFKHYVSIVKRGGRNFLINDLDFFPINYIVTSNITYAFYRKELTPGIISLNEIKKIINQHDFSSNIEINFLRSQDSFSVSIKSPGYPLRIETFLWNLTNVISIDQMIYLLKRTTFHDSRNNKPFKLSDIISDITLRYILFSLVTRNKTESVQYLIDNGINSAITDTYGTPILEYARANGYDEMVNILQRNRPNIRLSDLDLASAIENGDIEKAKKIIEMYKSGDLDPDFLNIGGSRSTPLMWAAYINDKSIIESLIDLGANVELIDSDGNRALDFLDRSNPNYEYNRKLLMTQSERDQEQQEQEQRRIQEKRRQEQFELQQKQIELERYKKQEYDRALREEQEQRELWRKQGQERQERERIESLPHNRIFNIIMSSYNYTALECEIYILKRSGMRSLISKMNNDYPSEREFIGTLYDFNPAEQREIFANLRKKTKEERVSRINREVQTIRSDRTQLIDFLVKEFSAAFKISPSQVSRIITKYFRERDKSRFFRFIFDHLIGIEELNNLNPQERKEFVRKFRREIKRR